MRMVHVKERARRAFTLVELIVVIAIIGVLVSLLLAAVMKALSKGDEAEARSDIGQLAQACQAFQVQYKIKDPFPSRIKLCKKFPQSEGGYNMSQQLDRDSAEFIQRLWPKITMQSGSNTVWAAPGNRVDWDGSSAATGSWTLQGQECLVFFLGGIPTTSGGVNGCTGFATNPSDPSYHVKTAGATVNPPLYDFKSNRLKVGQSLKFFHYLDAYGKQPYAYFSSYKTMNGYNRYFLTPGGSDCASLPSTSPEGPWPYAEDKNRYLNPNGFQIISPGKDGVFGKGSPDFGNTGPWFRPGQPMYAFGTAGYDDMSNFHDRFLGIPAD